MGHSFSRLLGIICRSENLSYNFCKGVNIPFKNKSCNVKPNILLLMNYLVFDRFFFNGHIRLRANSLLLAGRKQFSTMKMTITLAHNNECSESMSVCACASVCEYEQNRPKKIRTKRGTWS